LLGEEQKEEKGGIGGVWRFGNYNGVKKKTPVVSPEKEGTGPERGSKAVRCV